MFLFLLDRLSFAEGIRRGCGEARGVVDYLQALVYPIYHFFLLFCFLFLVWLFCFYFWSEYFYVLILVNVAVCMLMVLYVVYICCSQA